jgi:2',3'-cyclic-nucleotide 2'-phosphodiesterase (5'-nucleotidase family)
VGGHTHSLIDFDSSGAPIVQARSRGNAIGIIDIPLQNGKPAGAGTGEVRSVVATEVAAHPAIDSIVKRASASVASLVNRPIARLAEPMPRTGSQYALGNLIADAARVIGRADIGVMNNGGIRAALPAGTVTYGQLFEVHPFGNRLYRVRMSGAQLRTYLEQIVARESLREHVSGITIGYNPELPKGQRITSLRLPDGRTLSDAAMYTVAMNEFMAVGGGEGVAVPEGAPMTALEQLDLDVLISYLQRSPQPVAAPDEHRIVITQ